MLTFKQIHPLRGKKITIRFNGKERIAEIVWIYGNNQYYLVKMNDNIHFDGARYEIVDKNTILPV